MNCAFLLCSCDSYEDTWEPHFQLLAKYWPDIPFPIYLNTETLQFVPSVSLPFSVTTINSPKARYWSERMLRVLREIPEEYIFLTLDDLFLKSPVKGKMIEQMLQKLQDNPDIASIRFWAHDQEIRDVDTPELVEVGQDGDKTLFVPTLWRKSVLMKWLRPHESIWGFELYGSQRARHWKYPEKVYTVHAPVIYDYLLITGCSTIINGRWLDDQAVDCFFADNGIQIDFSTRGRLSLEEYRNRTMKDTLKHYTPWQIVQRMFFRVCSFF